MGLMRDSSSRRAIRGRKQVKKGPTYLTLVPMVARPIIEAVHRRYLDACDRGERPAIDDPRCRGALLTATECAKLAECGYWPLPPEVIKRGGTSEEHRRERLLDLIRDTLASDMPAVFDLLAKGRGRLP